MNSTILTVAIVGFCLVIPLILIGMLLWRDIRRRTAPLVPSPQWNKPFDVDLDTTSLRPASGIYLTLKSVPELAVLPSSERSEVWRSHFLYSFKHWQTWLAVLFLGFSITAGAYLAYEVIHSLVFIALGIFLGTFVLLQVAISQLRPHLREYLERKRQVSAGQGQDAGMLL